MAVLNNTGIRAGASGAGGGGYQIEKSLRFNDGDSTYLNRTPSSSGSSYSWTWSGWVKLNRVGSGTSYLLVADAAPYVDAVAIRAGGSLSHYEAYVGWTVTSEALLRDPSAWYHLVCAVDTTQSTPSDRIKLYINGEVVTSFTTTPTYSTEDRVLGINASGTRVQLGRWGTTDGSDFQLAEVHFIDGEQLTASDFGETNATTGQWVPIDCSEDLTYGTNGFYLKFNGTDLGEDSSGNDNDFTANNLVWDAFSQPTADQTMSATSAAWDGDTGTYAYAALATTWTFSSAVAAPANRLDIHARTGWTWTASTNLGTVTLTDNGVTWPGGGSYAGWHSYSNASLTTINSISVSAGANWTLQGVQVAGSPSSVGNQFLIARDASEALSTDTPTPFDDEGNGTGNYATLNPLENEAGTPCTLSQGNLGISVTSTGHVRSTIGMSSGEWYCEYTHGTGLGMIGLADGETETAFYLGQATKGNGYGYYSTGTTYGNDTGGAAYGASYTTGDVIGVAFDADAGTLTFYKNNTSQGTAFTSLTSGPYFFAVGVDTMADAVMNFGQRPFAYTPPSGYLALNTFNLDAPTIEDPSKHFDVGLDAGADILSTALDLTDGADFVWIKDRDNSDDHILFNRINDSGMDGTPHMRSNETDDESTCGTYSAPSGNSVAWVWNAGTTNVFNDASATGVGSIDSTYRVNPSAGFSIVSYTGTGSVGTIAHGLNAKIDFAIFKNREDTQSWAVYHKEMGNTHYIKLDEGIVPVDDVNAWNDTDPTSSIMTLGSNTSVNASTEEIVAYMWSEVEGYSKFGKFIGNGAADGPFIYCGFKPAFIMFGPNVNYSDWYIYDNERWPHNPAEDPLAANETMTEANFDARPITNHVDILSNGFKLRFADTSGYHNYSTWTYSFVAFADSSFKYSNAR